MCRRVVPPLSSISLSLSLARARTHAARATPPSQQGAASQRETETQQRPVGELEQTGAGQDGAEQDPARAEQDGAAERWYARSPYGSVPTVRIEPSKRGHATWVSGAAVGQPCSHEQTLLQT